MGENITKLRMDHNLSQESLAGAVGVSEMAIMQYEKNLWQPGMEVLSKLATFFGVSVVDVVGNCHILKDPTTGAQIILRNTNGTSIKVFGKLCDVNTPG